jgi:hypothetical protein
VILQVDTSFGPTLLVVLVGVIGWLAFSGRLDRFDAIVLTTVLGYGAAVIVGRVLPGISGIATDRYAYKLSLMLVPVLVPKIRIPATRMAYAAVVVACIFFGTNHVDSLQRGLEFWVAESTDSRAHVETAAAFIAAGEPAGTKHRIHPLARPLDAESVRRLLGDGWRPVASADPEVASTVRGRLRLASSATGAARGRPLATTAPVDGDGCVAISPGAVMRADVTGAGSVTLAGEGGAVLITWRDEFGVGTFPVDVGSAPLRLRYVEPATTAAVEFIAESGAVTGCGFRSAR